MTKEERKKLKEMIEDIEYNDNGFNHLSGTDVRVLNLHVDKNARRVYYDCILYKNVETGHSERFNDCYLSFDTLKIN
jgi:hypothetical protein